MDRQWNFEAHSAEDRDDWVSHIDQAIITRLQLLDSSNKRPEGGFYSGSAGHGGDAGSDMPSNNWSVSIPGSGTTGSDPGGVKDGERGENMRVDEAMAKSLRAVSGNDACADCGAPGKCEFFHCFILFHSALFIEWTSVRNTL